jgi:hypothetical protein
MGAFNHIFLEIYVYLLNVKGKVKTFPLQAYGAQRILGD